MAQKVAYITVPVKEYDEAIEFYTQKLNFDLIMNARLNDSKRLVLMAVFEDLYGNLRDLIEPSDKNY